VRQSFTVAMRRDCTNSAGAFSCSTARCLLDPQIVELIIRHVEVEATAIFDSTFVRSDSAGVNRKENQVVGCFDSPLPKTSNWYATPKYLS